MTTTLVAFATATETVTRELAPRNALTVSYEPSDDIVHALVEYVNAPTIYTEKPFGVVVGIGRGFFGEPVATVISEDGESHEVGHVLPPASSGRGPIGWHLVSSARATPDVLVRIADGLVVARARRSSRTG